APELVAVGWHLDTVHPKTGPLVEALEARDPARWVFGVQWHPENLVGLHGPAGEAARDLFAAFVAALNRRCQG
ncbi:MAG: C26 family cysteine hydrolase domain-containing family, partial [Holophagaceae bacterium]|nr:C26 family cysteine hydrolase domain-containing family [Holophagaceae bacterium]